MSTGILHPFIDFKRKKQRSEKYVPSLDELGEKARKAMVV